MHERQDNNKGAWVAWKMRWKIAQTEVKLTEVNKIFQSLSSLISAWNAQ